MCGGEKNTEPVTRYDWMSREWMVIPICLILDITSQSGRMDPQDFLELLGIYQSLISRWSR